MEDLIAQALRNRPDLAQGGIQVQNSEIALKGSLNALRPELDVVGTVQNGGISGNISPVGAAQTPGAALYPGGYGTVLGQIFKNNFPTYAVGLQLNLPVRNRVAQADAVRDEMQVRQTQVRRQQLEDQVRLEVADAYVALRQARASCDAAVESRKLQEQSVEVEQLTFDVGVATNYLVIQYQTYLAQARSTEVAAKGAYAKAKLALDRATASTLEVNRVSVEECGGPCVPPFNAEQSQSRETPEQPLLLTSRLVQSEFGLFRSSSWGRQLWRQAGFCAGASEAARKGRLPPIMAAPQYRHDKPCAPGVPRT